MAPFFVSGWREEEERTSAVEQTLTGGSRTGLGEPTLCWRRAAPIGCTAIGSSLCVAGGEGGWKKKMHNLAWIAPLGTPVRGAGRASVCVSACGLTGGTTTTHIELSLPRSRPSARCGPALCHVWRVAAGAWPVDKREAE